MIVLFLSQRMLTLLESSARAGMGRTVASASNVASRLSTSDRWRIGVPPSKEALNGVLPYAAGPEPQTTDVMWGRAAVGLYRQ